MGHSRASGLNIGRGGGGAVPTDEWISPEKFNQLTGGENGIRLGELKIGEDNNLGLSRNDRVVKINGELYGVEYDPRFGEYRISPLAKEELNNAIKETPSMFSKAEMSAIEKAKPIAGDFSAQQQKLKEAQAENRKIGEEALRVGADPNNPGFITAAGMSVRAAEAYERGELTVSQFARAAGVSEEVAKAWATGGWHHTGDEFGETKFVSAITIGALTSGGESILGGFGKLAAENKAAEKIFNKRAAEAEQKLRDL